MPELWRQRIVQETLEDLDAVTPGASHGRLVDLGCEHPRRGLGNGEHGRDRAGARAEVDGDTSRWKERRGASRQRLGLSSRNVDARRDEHADVAERDRADQPRDRLTVDPTANQVVEDVKVTVGRADEFNSFLSSIDAARLDQPPPHRGAIQVSHRTFRLMTLPGEDVLSRYPSGSASQSTESHGGPGVRLCSRLEK